MFHGFAIIRLHRRPNWLLPRVITISDSKCCEENGYCKMSLSFLLYLFIYLSKVLLMLHLTIGGSCRNWSKKLEKCKWKPKLLLVDNKSNNGNTRTIYEICSELTIKTQERCQKRLNILVISSMTSMEHEQNEYYQI